MGKPDGTKYGCHFPVDECINKMWYTHTIEYCSALKREELLTQASTWMSLEDIMLSEVSQTQKDKYCKIALIQSTWNSQIHRDRRQNGGCQGLGGGANEELLHKGDRVSVWEDRINLEMSAGEGCTMTQRHLMPMNCTLKDG